MQLQVKMKLSQKIAIGYIRARINIMALVSPSKAAAIAFRLFCTPHRSVRKKIPPIFEKGEKLTFEIEGLTVKGMRWNDPCQVKVLIIHGFESSSLNFDRYIVPLIRKGYEVVAFDAPAHGRSGGKSVNLPMYTKMLQQVVILFGPFQSFIAHSFGGLALSHLLEITEHTSETKAVLIAPATETTSAIDSFFHFLQLNSSIRSAFDELIIQLGGFPASYYSIRRAMKKIKAKVLWIHDEEDEVTSIKDALQVKEDLHKHIIFVITKGLGHRRIYKENKVVKTVMEFL